MTPGKIVRGRMCKPKPQFTKVKWPWRECENLLMSGDQKSLKHCFFSITHFLSPCSTCDLVRILTMVCLHPATGTESLSNKDKKATVLFSSA